MFQYPAVIYSILPIGAFLVLLYIQSRRWRNNKLKRLTEADIARASKNHSSGRARLKILLVVFGLIFLIVAAARPQYGHRWSETGERKTQTLILLDVSRSMLVEDIYPNRLGRAKLLLREMFLEDGALSQVGLLVFSSIPFLHCPITSDPDAFSSSLESLEPSILPHQGSNLSKLLMALPEFLEENVDSTIILISDGEDHSHTIDSALAYLKNEGVKIHSVCIGTEKGDLIPAAQINPDGEPYFYDEAGNVIFSKANPSVLQNIATELGGEFVHLSSESYSVRQLRRLGIQARQLASAPMVDQKKVPIERYQIPLIAAFLLLCLETAMGTRKSKSSSRK